MLFMLTFFSANDTREFVHISISQYMTHVHLFETKRQSHIKKKNQRPTIFETKKGFFWRQSAVHQPLSWPIGLFFVGRSTFCPSGQVIFFPSMADFFCWSGPWIVRRANLDHRQTIGTHTSVYVVNRSTLRYLINGFFWNADVIKVE